jgi:hypothetical protein
MVERVGEPACVRTPRNRNPSGWRTEGKSTRLAKGMPSVSPTGLKGERSWSRAERSAENLGLDEEMLRAKDSLLFASEEPPGPRRPASQALTS